MAETLLQHHSTDSVVAMSLQKRDLGAGGAAGICLGLVVFFFFLIFFFLWWCIVFYKIDVTFIRRPSKSDKLYIDSAGGEQQEPTLNRDLEANILPMSQNTELETPSGGPENKCSTTLSAKTPNDTNDTNNTKSKIFGRGIFKKSSSNSSIASRLILHRSSPTNKSDIAKDIITDSDSDAYDTVLLKKLTDSFPGYSGLDYVLDPYNNTKKIAPGKLVVAVSNRMARSEDELDIQEGDRFRILGLYPNGTCFVLRLKNWLYLSKSNTLELIEEDRSPSYSERITGFIQLEDVSLETTVTSRYQSMVANND